MRRQFLTFVGFGQGGIAVSGVPVDGDDKGAACTIDAAAVYLDVFNHTAANEGGFEQKEIEKLQGIGASIVTLGPRILRTETAGLVAATMIFYELGDLGVV